MTTIPDFTDTEQKRITTTLFECYSKIMPVQFPIADCNSAAIRRI